MGMIEWVAALLTAGLMVYLTWALVFPERF